MSLSIEERQLIELRIRNDAPSAVVAYVMWGFLGLISAHRFYLGRPRSAVLQILSELTVVGWFIWWLYDAVMISAYIRDDKTALRAKLIEELESEKRGGAPAPRPRAVETPTAAPTPAPAPAPAKAPPLAAAAAMPVKPAEPAADADLVLVSRPGQPLVLGEPRAAPVEAAAPAPAPEAPPKVAIKLDDRAETQAAAAMAFSEPAPVPAPEPEPEVKTVSIPHPEAVDDSPIEVFPPKPAEGAPAKADEWVMGEPLRLDRNP